jgi:hypothetical protein
MDDFTVSGLHESKNEWAARLLTILTPHIIEGFNSIMNESLKMCRENDENDKYLMTFQNLVARIPKWNTDIVSNETKRIIEKSGCEYLEDLITCVHVIQLKILTAVRVGQKQKKVDIDVMNINEFIHKVYINSARQLYKNVYLFDIDCPPLLRQKNNREIEIIIQECILTTIRNSIPVNEIIKCYLDETTEEDITEEIKEEDITPVVEESPNVDLESIEEMKNGGSNIIPIETSSNIIDNQNTHDIQTNAQETQGLSFNDIDTAVDTNKNEYAIDAPKTIARLEELSDIRHADRKSEETDDDDDNGKLSISTETIKLDSMDVHNIDESSKLNATPLLLNEVEILD